MKIVQDFRYNKIAVTLIMQLMSCNLPVSVGEPKTQGGRHDVRGHGIMPAVCKAPRKTEGFLGWMLVASGWMRDSHLCRFCLGIEAFIVKNFVEAGLGIQREGRLVR